MRLLHCFFAGVPNERDWSQSFAHQTEDIFFGLVVHVGSPVTTVAETGKTILSRAVEAASEIKRESFLEFFKQWNQPGIDLAAIFIQGDKALLFAQGETYISLNRRDSQQTLLRGMTTGQFVEGQCMSGDYYTLGTNDFAKYFTAQESEKLPQDACDLCVANLHKVADSSKVTALFVKLKAQDEVVAPVIVPAIRQEPALPAVAPPVRPTFKLPRLSLGPKGTKYFRLGIIGLVGILFLLFFSSFLSARKARDLAKTLLPYQERYDQLLALPSEKQVDKLSGLRELSRDLTDRSKQTKEASLKRAYEQLLTKVDRSFAEGSGEKHLDKLSVYYDFRLIAPDFVATAVAYDIPGKLVVFLDGSHSRLLSLALEKKEAQTLSVDEKLSRPFALAVENRKAYVLGDDGVMELSLPLDKMGSIVIPKNNTWVTPKLIDAFGTNAYIFDGGARNVMKYDLSDPGSSPSAWLRNKEGIDFETVTSMRIDGGLWLGDRSGKLLRFMQGAPAAFTYQHVLDQPTSAIYVYSTQENDKLYVLEPQAKRLLILSKAGEYQSSITSDDLGTATGLIVDETANKAYVLSGSLVYEVGL